MNGQLDLIEYLEKKIMSDDLDARRLDEMDKYDRTYARTDKKYRMSRPRFRDAVRAMEKVAPDRRSSYLDVSCGYGAMLDAATTMGFQRVHGTEIIPKLIDGERVFYAEAHSLPFHEQFDVVSNFDVIEHLLPGDDEALCREMRRLARFHIFIMANNDDSLNQFGEQLHVNKRLHDEWHLLFEKWFAPFSRIARLPSRHQTNRISQMWRIDI